LEVFLVVISHPRKEIEGFPDDDIPELFDKLVCLKRLSRNVQAGNASKLVSQGLYE